jgi:hypothetical protein
MRPGGIAAVAAQLEYGAAALDPGVAPRRGAGEAVPGQRAAFAELREDHRDAAADRGAAVEHRAFGQEQALAAIGRPPRQHVGAVQGDQRGRAFGVDADAGQTAVFGGFGVHRRSFARRPRAPMR